MRNFIAAFMARLTGGVVMAFFAGASIGLAAVGTYRGLISASDALKLCVAASVALGVLVSEI
jgi:hypothetical protein